MTDRARARADDAIYAAGGLTRARLVQLGDRVRALGEVGLVTAIDLSVATGTRIVTVEASPRVRLRVAERDVVLA